MGNLKIYTGTSWADAIERSARVWNGTAWIPIKAGDHVRRASAWVEITSGAPAPRQWYNSGDYDPAAPGLEAMTYIPPGDNTSPRPLIIFLHGAGQNGTNIADVLGDGLPQLIEAGQDMQECIVFCPQTDIGWNVTKVKAGYDFALANLNIDSTRVYVVGLSNGAQNAIAFAVSFPALVAAYISASSPANTAAANVATIKDIASFWMIGMQDAFVGVGNTTSAIDALLAADGLHAPRSQTIFAGDHTGATWNDHLFNTATADFNFETDFLLKHSTNKETEATAYVTYAESKLTYLSYLEALHVVNALSAGATKTALLFQLSTLYDTITPAGSRRVMIDFGTNTHPATGNYTKIISTEIGNTVNDLIDTTGAITSIDFRSEYTQWDADLTGLSGVLFGLPEGVYADGRKVYAGNDWRFQGLDNGKTYSIEILYTYKSESGTAHYGFTATIGGVAKNSIEDVYNSINTLQFTAISPSSGQIVMTLNGQYTSSANEGMITAIILTENA